MTTHSATLSMTGDGKYEPAPVNVRTKIAALWTAMLFVFAFVDIFSLYRPDVRRDLDAGQIGGIAVEQGFLVAITLYVVIPSLMVFGALLLRPRVNRIANIALSGLLAATIIGAAIGEWGYYLIGSAVEVALLASIVYYAWTWPKVAPSASTSGSGGVATNVRPATPEAI